MRKLIISLVSLAMCLPVMAQEFLGDVEPEEPEVRRYSVEVIIFRYAQEVSTGSEIFPRDKPESEVLSLDAERPRRPPDTELVLMDEADFQLNEIMGRMKRLDVYKPVMHFGWTQATWPEEQTEAIPLHRLARPPAGLDGDLTLYLSRYLHLVVDLQLDAPRVMVDLADMPGAQDELPVRYRIQENRILKNGELRYYDHPKFGVLAKVTRVEEEEKEAGVTELLGYGSE